MGRETSNLLPKHVRLVAALGENLRLARLRRKLGGTFIETVRGMGYRIEGPA